MNGYSDMAVLENVGGVAIYPKKALAIAGYDPSSVTTLKKEAYNFKALATIVYHITVIGGVFPSIGQAHIYNTRLGLPAFIFNLDATPNMNMPGLNSGSLPRTVEFGPHGMRFPFGIGVRCMSPSARIHVYYRTLF